MARMTPRTAMLSMSERLGAWALLAAVTASAIGCSAGTPVSLPTPDQVTPVAPAPPDLLWRESFSGPELTWLSPMPLRKETILRVYSVAHESDQAFLHAHHDAFSDDAPPAVHFGKSFRDQKPALSSIRLLRWKWRVLEHPQATGDPWKDIAASLYVATRQPSLFRSGRGLKLAWLSSPGPHGTVEHGFAQFELRHDPPGPQWKQEEVDICGLYRQAFGTCEGEHLVYIGVMTDADNTRSRATADYADFELVMSR